MSEKPRPTVKQRWVRVGKTVAAVAVVVALLMVGAGVVAYRSISVPAAAVAFQQNVSLVLYADGTAQAGRFQAGDQSRMSVPGDRIPVVMKQAAVAAEDPTFYKNDGIDLRQVLRGEGSTITEQYVRAVYLNNAPSYRRKIKQAVLAVKLAKKASKDEVLTGYLNTIYFGRGTYGVEAASEAYFDRPVADLTLQDAAALAALIDQPVGLDGADLLARYQDVLNGMVELGYVRKETAAKARAQLPAFSDAVATRRLGDQTGHLLTLVKNELLGLKDGSGAPLLTEDQIDGGGLRVTSTLSSEAMSASEKAAEEALKTSGRQAVDEKSGQPDALHVASATVDVKTGALLGFYGGQDYLDSQVDWAATGAPAGATMEPFAVAAALQSGGSLTDTYTGDSPFTTSDGLQVVNEGDHDFGRAITLTEALEHSVNTAFIDLTQSMGGSAKGRAAIHQMALSSGLPADRADTAFPGIPATSPDLTAQDNRIALGRARVSPVNLANAYATLADQGVRHDVHVVAKVTGPSGKVIYQWSPSGTTKAMDPKVAGDVTHVLRQSAGSVAAARGVRQPVSGVAASGTCGARNARCSSWFVGTTPQIATAVALSRGGGLGQLEGWLPAAAGDLPATTWTKIVGALTE